MCVLLLPPPQMKGALVPPTPQCPTHTPRMLSSVPPPHTKGASCPYCLFLPPSLSMGALWFLVWFFSSFSFFVLRAASASVTQTPCVLLVLVSLCRAQSSPLQVWTLQVFQRDYQPSLLVVTFYFRCVDSHCEILGQHKGGKCNAKCLCASWCEGGAQSHLYFSPHFMW